MFKLTKNVYYINFVTILTMAPYGTCSARYNRWPRRSRVIPTRPNNLLYVSHKRRNYVCFWVWKKMLARLLARMKLPPLWWRAPASPNYIPEGCTGCDTERVLIWENPRWMIFEVIQLIVITSREHHSQQPHECIRVRYISVHDMLYINTPPNLYTVHMCRDYTKRYEQQNVRYTIQPTSTHNKLLLASCLLNTTNQVFCAYFPDTHTLLWRRFDFVCFTVSLYSCNFFLTSSWLQVSVPLENHDSHIPSIASLGLTFFNGSNSLTLDN